MVFLIIDLCCGKKGSTQSFLENPNYEVITIDIDMKVKPTIVADVRYLPLKDNLKPALVWCSPPCNNLSLAKPKHWINSTIKDTFEIIGACFDAVYRLKPKRWILENPRGRLKTMLPNSIEIEYETINEYQKGKRKFKHKKTNLWSNDNRTLARAFIPKHISNSILKWCEEK